MVFILSPLTLPRGEILRSAALALPMFGNELTHIGVWWVSGRNATGLTRDLSFVEPVIFGERVNGRLGVPLS